MRGAMTHEKVSEISNADTPMRGAMTHEKVSEIYGLGIQ
jgi:hypothetical protein